MKPAIFIVHWPGKDVFACEEHTNKLIILGAQLGCPVSFTPYLGDEICKNCKNEEIKQLEKMIEL